MFKIYASFYLRHFAEKILSVSATRDMVMITGILMVLLMRGLVNSNDCPKYNLSSSDQLLIDMIQHYLYSSRRTEVKAHSNTGFGTVYTRWGRKTCPRSAELVYTGQVGGMQHNVQGGGVNKLCLPNDPENGQAYSYNNDALYGSEYQIHGSSKPSGLSTSLFDKEVPCAVCRRPQVSSIIMIPARKTCYRGWNIEYNGYLMTEHKTHYRTDYACIDMNAEPLDDSNGNEDGVLFYPVRTKCGSLRCPPYKNETEVYCVVCSK